MTLHDCEDTDREVDELRSMVEARDARIRDLETQARQRGVATTITSILARTALPADGRRVVFAIGPTGAVERFDWPADVIDDIADRIEQEANA